ncbi:Prp4 [Kluyveromyces lactis]|nr:Prp4 [Kluyveromyces lactis]
MVELDDLQVDVDYKNQDGQSVGDDLKRLEFQRQERLKIVPTLDADVRRALELVGEPVDIAGEDNYSRRDRLSDLIFSDPKVRERVTRLVESTSKDQTRIDTERSKVDDADEEFYTPASQQLIEVRKFLITYSMQRSKLRLEEERRRLVSQNVKNVISKRRDLESKLKQFSLKGMQVIDEKPISEINTSPGEELIACGSWSGNLSLVDNSLSRIYCNRSLSGTKISGLDWSVDSKNIFVCTHDGRIVIYDSSDETTVKILYKNDARFAQVRCHPCNSFIGSTSFDKTWILIDTVKQAPVLIQEGHSAEVFSLAFHNDGSLVSTAGLDAIALIWDIRSGKNIMSLQGHSKPIYSVDWSPNGYQLASGSGDGTIKVWDIRKKGNAETILAHNSIVSQVKFNKQNGGYLVSSGYDKKVNIFNYGNWIKERSLEGHLDKVMSIDIVGSDIYSAGWDRSVNKWGA